MHKKAIEKRLEWLGGLEATRALTALEVHSKTLLIAMEQAHFLLEFLEEGMPTMTELKTLPKSDPQQLTYEEYQAWQNAISTVSSLKKKIDDPLTYTQELARAARVEAFLQWLDTEGLDEKTFKEFYDHFGAYLDLQHKMEESLRTLKEHAREGLEAEEAGGGQGQEAAAPPEEA